MVTPADPGATPKWHGLAVSEVLLMGPSWEDSFMDSGGLSLK